MGQAISRCLHPNAADENPAAQIDEADLQPRGVLYKDWQTYFKKRKVRKLILQGRIAPCYAGKDEDPEMELEWCPVCHYYYPALNRCKCSEGICTECYLQITVNKKNVLCPVCQRPLETTFNGPLPPAERIKRRMERLDQEAAAIRARQAEQKQHGSQHVQPKLSPKDAAAAGPPKLNRPAGYFNPQRQDESNQSTVASSVDISAASGNSSPQQPKMQSGSTHSGMETKGPGPDQSSNSQLPPITKPLIGMVFCKYNSRPLPPLFAMLGAFSGLDGPVGEESDAAVPSDMNARDAVQTPSLHAGSGSEAAEADSIAMSSEIAGSADAPEASRKGSGSESITGIIAAPSNDQHAFNAGPVCPPDCSSEEGSQNMDMPVKSKCTDMAGSQQQSSSEEQECKADDFPNAMALHFGINEPVLMVNPDGSKVYVLLSDEQAAKQQEAQKRKDEEAAAIAAAKAATYWAPSDDHDAAVLAAIEREDAAVRQRLALQQLAPSETHTSSPEASSSRPQTQPADDSFEARCRAADEALTAIINRRDAEVAARTAEGQPATSDA